MARARNASSALLAGDIAPDRRPQTLSVEAWMALAAALGPLDAGKHPHGRGRRRPAMMATAPTPRSTWRWPSSAAVRMASTISSRSSPASTWPTSSRARPRGPDRLETADSSIAQSAGTGRQLVLQAVEPSSETTRAPGAGGLDLPPDQARAPGGRARGRQRRCRGRARPRGSRLGAGADRRRATDLAARLGSDVPFFAAGTRCCIGHRPRRAPRATAWPTRSGRRPARDQRPALRHGAGFAS